MKLRKTLAFLVALMFAFGAMTMMVSAATCAACNGSGSVASGFVCSADASHTGEAAGACTTKVGEACFVGGPTATTKISPAPAGAPCPECDGTILVKDDYWLWCSNSSDPAFPGGPAGECEVGGDPRQYCEPGPCGFTPGCKGTVTRKGWGTQCDTDPVCDGTLAAGSAECGNCGGTGEVEDGGNDGVVAPPSGGGTTPPGGGTTPPSGGDGGTVAPPSGGDGGTVAPPSGGDGGTVAPPSGGDGGSAITPPTGGNAGDSGSAPATGGGSVSTGGGLAVIVDVPASADVTPDVLDGLNITQLRLLAGQLGIDYANETSAATLQNRIAGVLGLDDWNPKAGVTLAFVPAILAAAAVVVSRKRK